MISSLYRKLSVLKYAQTPYRPIREMLDATDWHATKAYLEGAFFTLIDFVDEDINGAAIRVYELEDYDYDDDYSYADSLEDYLVWQE